MGHVDSRKEPGNRAGALGLLPALLGAWALIPEVPALPPEWSASFGWSFLALGILLAATGLVIEWRGPRRWSALVPGIVLLDFCLALAGVAAWRTTLSLSAYAPEMPTGSRVYEPARGEAETGVLLAARGQDDWRLMQRLAAALARNGVLAVVLADGATPLPADLEAVRALGPGVVRVGALAFGPAGSDPGCLEEADPDFLALVSVPLDADPALGPDGPDLLGVYGFDDAVISPHVDGQRLAAAFAASGRPRQAVRLFIGSDHQLRRSRGGGLLPAPFGAGFVGRLVSWMEGGEF
ncbi:MAG: hypothetical protein R3E10_13980 [Gemmatimonadota bacterium]